MQSVETCRGRDENFRACHERNKWRTKEDREEVAFGMQPAGSVERVHFDNFALISHTRDSPCGAGLTLPGVPETNPRALRLPVASIKPVSKISPAIPRPGEKQTPRRDVQNMLIHTHTHTRTHAHTHARAKNARESEFGCVVATEIFLRFLFPLFSRDLTLPFRPVSSPFPCHPPRTHGAGRGLSGSTRRG